MSLYRSPDIKSPLKNTSKLLFKSHTAIGFYVKTMCAFLASLSVGRGIWNHNIDQASKEARKAHWIWKNKGNPNGSAESERKDMIKKKRTLRQVQRQAYVSKKDKLISEIMEASQDDSKHSTNC